MTDEDQDKAIAPDWHLMPFFERSSHAITYLYVNGTITGTERDRARRRLMAQEAKRERDHQRKMKKMILGG
mgnify:CR=1 FL=1